MPGERRHITKRSDGLWQDKREDAQRAGGLYPTQAEAQAGATERLNRTPGGGEVIIHRADGQIRNSNTINRPDPNPPRDARH